MSCKQPTSNFRWLNQDEIEALDIMQMNSEQETGYIFEVDLHYSTKLHTYSEHHSYPIAPHSMHINESHLSTYSQECHKFITGKEKYKSKKLCATFQDRSRYAVHYTNLKTYLELGLKIKKIHRVLAFTQTYFLKEYIDKCTQMRQKSKTEFGKRLFKLFANSCFGKFLEAVRNYSTVTLCRTERKCMNALSSPNFSNFKIITDDLVAVFGKTKYVKLNKAFPIGFTILEISKDFMTRSFYFQIRPLLHDCDVQVIMSDTDSFMLRVENQGKIDHLARLSPIMDFSNYDKTSKRYNAKNAGCLGYFKDELAGKKMEKFAGLRSKNYAYITDQLHTRCKGIKKAYKKNLTFAMYKRCIDSISQEYVTFYNIRSKNHLLFTQRITKRGLGSFDDKRVLFCGTHSAPHFSKYIKKAEKTGKCPFC